MNPSMLKAKEASLRLQRMRRLTGGYYVDPTPGPYPGHDGIRWRRHETPEQRAFRRYPIDSHKPRFEDDKSND